MTTTFGSAKLEQLVVSTMAEHPGGVMAQAAMLAASSVTPNKLVLASVISIDLARTIPVGHLLTLLANVTAISHSTMTVSVVGKAASPGTEAQDVLKGIFEIEAIDTTGRPVAIEVVHLDKGTSA